MRPHPWSPARGFWGAAPNAFLEEGGPSVPLVNLGRSGGPRMRGRGVWSRVSRHGTQEKGPRSLRESGGQRGSPMPRWEVGAGESSGSTFLSTAGGALHPDAWAEPED